MSAGSRETTGPGGIGGMISGDGNRERQPQGSCVEAVWPVNFSLLRSQSAGEALAGPVPVCKVGTPAARRLPLLGALPCPHHTAPSDFRGPSPLPPHAPPTHRKEELLSSQTPRAAPAHWLLRPAASRPVSWRRCDGTPCHTLATRRPCLFRQVPQGPSPSLGLLQPLAPVRRFSRLPAEIHN